MSSIYRSIARESRLARCASALATQAASKLSSAPAKERYALLAVARDFDRRAAEHYDNVNTLRRYAAE